MNRKIPAHRRLRALTAAAAGFAAAITLSAAASTQAAAAVTAAHPAHSNVRNACGPVEPGLARCLAIVRTDLHAGKGVRGAAARRAGLAVTALPPGYGPADLRSAYDLPATGGASQTVAVVEAGDTPTAEADLGVYRQTYGLPPCTTANGCFSKVNQAGQASPLPTDQFWDVETALDVDMVSAACPACHILLVEANSESFDDLGAAVDTAVSLGATEVSNSYGATEQNGMQSLEPDYAHPGVAVIASSGDFGYGIPLFPAVLPTVIAAGGTTLTKASNARGWTESAWQGSGSGCSAYIAKPAWQHDPNCPGRMTADVAAVADPNTGVAMYDTDNGEPGWLVIGGTSVSSPFLAGVIALAGNPAALPDASYIYAHARHLYDITHGNNVTFSGCGGDYQCRAVRGYDGPTGEGTPHGTGGL